MLICDDDELELAALKRTATEAGFEVVDTARHAVELLQLVQVHRPEAALVRNEVYGVSGVEVTEDLTHLEQPVEVILLTTDPSLEPHGLGRGRLRRGATTATSRSSRRRWARSASGSAEGSAARGSIAGAGSTVASSRTGRRCSPSAAAATIAARGRDASRSDRAPVRARLAAAADPGEQRSAPRTARPRAEPGAAGRVRSPW